MAIFIDTSRTLLDNLGSPVVRRDQEVPDDYLAGLRDDRMESARAPAGNYHRVASVPVALAEQWMRQGFNVYEESAKAILKRLQDHDLGAFITTTKRI